MPKGNRNPNRSGLRPPWKPGESGNQSGIKGRNLPLKNAYRWFLAHPAFDSDVEELVSKGVQLPENPTQADIIACGQIRRAITHPDSAKLVQEAVEGPAKYRLELMGEGGGPVQTEDVSELLSQKLLRK